MCFGPIFFVVAAKQNRIHRILACYHFGWWCFFCLFRWIGQSDFLSICRFFILALFALLFRYLSPHYRFINKLMSVGSIYYEDFIRFIFLSNEFACIFVVVKERNPKLLAFTILFLSFVSRNQKKKNKICLTIKEFLFLFNFLPCL